MTTSPTIASSRRAAIRRIGRVTGAVVLGGIAACSGDSPDPGSSERAARSSSQQSAAGGLRRRSYTSTGTAGSDSDRSRQADPKGDNDVATSDPRGGADVTRTADPADADVTIYADPAGSGTDGDPYDPVGGGTDSDVTIPADPRTGRHPRRRPEGRQRPSSTS